MPVQSAFCFPPPAAAASGGAAGGEWCRVAGRGPRDDVFRPLAGGASPVAPGDVVKAHGCVMARPARCCVCGGAPRACTAAQLRVGGGRAGHCARGRDERWRVHVARDNTEAGGGACGRVRCAVSTRRGGVTPLRRVAQAEKQSLTRMWAWTLWTCDVPVPATAAAGSELRLHVRAVDSAYAQSCARKQERGRDRGRRGRRYNVQPERVDAIWNLRGVLNNAWHCVTVPVGPPKQG